MDKDSYKNAKIIENIKIAENVFKIKIEGKFAGKAGQFYMLRAWNQDPLLPRPFSICDIDDNSISFLYLVVGRGTEIISKLKENDQISLLGPLGNGFNFSSTYEKVAIVAGGIGIAPMLLLAKSLNCKADFYLGFRNEPYFIDELKPYANNIIISTDDGNVGTKGTVIDIFEDKNYDQIYSCGPNIMLKSLKNCADDKKMQLSLENHMACGIGACLGCTVETTSGLKRVCHEGPIFRASEVFNA